MTNMTNLKKVRQIRKQYKIEFFENFGTNRAIDCKIVNNFWF